jgi:hypothetical protein
MGSLLKEIREHPPKKGGVKKKILIILEQLDEQDRKDFLIALNDHQIRPNVIVRVMKQRGFSVSRSAVNRWRGIGVEP